MTLADYEKLCLHGSIGTVHPADELRALNRVQALAARYRERMEAHAAEWKPTKTARRHRAAGIELSLPKGDRE